MTTTSAPRRATTGVPATDAGALAGTARLARLALRRDRVKLPVWLVAVTLLTWASVASVVGLYPTEAERAEFAATSARSPVTLAFNGIVTGTSTGGITASQTLLIVLVAGALMCTLSVVRHTRQEEETGRAELVRSAAVGRAAGLAAALLVSVGAAVALGALTALTLVGSGLPWGGSLLSGAAVAAVGTAFAAVAALAAQVVTGARAANGLAGAVLGAAFLLRAVGDATATVEPGGTSVRSSWPSWLSPIGWGQQTRPYDDDVWVVLLLPLLLAAVCTAAAVVLLGRRDVGGGLVAPRPGPPAAAPALRSSLGLAWRLQRGTWLAWTVAVAVVYASYGGIGNEIEDLVASSDATADVFDELSGGGGDLIDAYFATVFAFLGTIVAAYLVQALLRLRAEETGSLETLLATSLDRRRWLLGHVAVVVVGAAVMVVVAGLACAASYALVTGDGSRTGALVGAALVQLPAAFVLGGFAVLVFGLRPRWMAGAAWGALAVCLALLLVGRLLDLPQLVLDLSPFAHVPALPSASFRAAPVLVLVAVATLLTAAGTAAFRRRDLVP